MSAPGWSRALLRRLAPEEREDEVLGDLEEAHRRRVRDRGRFLAGILTALETVDMAFALLRDRWDGGSVSLLDFKLGLRMLVRYPGLTTLGGLAIAFAIFAGAGTFEFLSQVAHPKLPFEDGDRMVGIELWNAAENRGHPRALFDYGVWQEELTTVEEIGAFDTVVRNVIVGERTPHVVTGALIDAAGFRITGVAPLMGRTLVEDDERPDAPLAVVLGYDVWQNVFAGDAGVVDRVVRVGAERATVVGVMPEGFTFPVAHGMWLPLRTDPGAVRPGEGAAISVFGRLAPGASLDDARAELEGVGRRLAAAFPATHEHLRPYVKPYARAMLGGLPASISDLLVTAVVMSWNIPLLLFLFLVCGNVALLMFARVAARESELVVRSALGAGRRRIVGQLFAEALVLAAVGAALGLAAAAVGLRWGYHVVEVELWGGPLPFWLRPELSGRTVVYTLVLTLMGAAVAGVLPALKATRGLGTRLRQATAGGGGFRFGGVWTAVIVSQIAVTVVAPVVTIAVGLEGRDIKTYDLGIPAHEYLTAQLTIQSGESGAPAPPATPSEDVDAPYAATLAELERGLLADSRVAGVTFAELVPRMYSGWHQIEVDGPTAPPLDERGHRLGAVDVEVDFFETLDIEPGVGRDFHPADAEEGSRAVIVNERFVGYVLGDRNALGLNFRYVDAEYEGYAAEQFSPWYEVVGVVQNLGRMSGYSGAVVYHPVARGTMNPVYALVHVRDDTEAFESRLRQVAFGVDPTLRIRDAKTLDRVDDSTVEFYRFWFWLLVMVSGVGVVLSLGGIYAVMAFTVARRTREIGIRVALGAPGTRIVLAVLRRPLIQVVVGILAGALLMAALRGIGDIPPSAREVGLFLAYLAVVTGVCLLACVVPTRHALAVEPSEALRSE